MKATPTTVQRSSREAFTLLELLVVVSIIAIVAGLAAPSFRKASGGGVMAAATRQLIDDLALARLKAITERTTVYVVFVPTNLYTLDFTQYAFADHADQAKNLVGSQYAGYALYSSRSVGDQPGFPNPRYLTEWKELPEGVFIPASAFSDPNVFESRTVRFPYELATNSTFNGFVQAVVPAIGFDPSGSLIRRSDVVLPLARGSVFYPLLPNGDFDLLPANVIETPPGNSSNNFNRIRINWLTGRTRVERPELP